ncbi:TetR/AcrR family transcriptional regulator [Nesterenkonia alba]|uniref:TetR/AcrR family transcriptional regulator n=1 Tax=Nesterenkonia alba TaxID=515814 RepID=UPI0003B30663|nr:TetR/AcrR family transcriptional regulator [Nesterenkonia alba]
MSTSPRQRAPRKDGLANREKILNHAEEYFSEHHLDASLHALVDQIGVGIGTLYRHFPTRDDLIRALYDRQVARMVEVFEAAAAIEDGWEAVVTAIDGILDLLIRYPGAPHIAARVAATAPDGPPQAQGQQQVLEIVSRAHAQGAIRPDVTAVDLAHIPTMLESILRLPEPARGIVLARQRAIILDGIRPQAVTTPLPATPLTGEDLHHLAHRKRTHTTPRHRDN